jgi:ribosomal protein S12 methylthiotransferase accessory factor
MVLDITLHDDDRVDARFDGVEVVTRQDGTAPAPFDLFLASIGTCSGYYVGQFCRRRGIGTDGIRIRQTAIRDADSGMVVRIDVDVLLPPGFPDKYRAAVVRAAESCSVKKHLAAPPEIRVSARGGDEEP